MVRRAPPTDLDRITFDAKTMAGLACLRGMRIPVSVILGQLAHGATEEEILGETNGGASPTLPLRLAEGQGGDEIDEFAGLAEPSLDLRCVEGDEIGVVSFLPVVVEQIEELAVLDGDQAGVDEFLVQKSAQMAVPARGHSSGQQQRGHGIEAGVVQAVHVGVKMVCPKQQFGLVKGFAGACQAVFDQRPLFSRHMTTPSRVTFWCRGIARYWGESHRRRL